MLTEWAVRGKPTVLRRAQVAAGLVAITPAPGFCRTRFIDSHWRYRRRCLALFAATSALKNALGHDDSLDAFGVRGIGGTWGDRYGSFRNEDY